MAAADDLTGSAPLGFHITQFTIRSDKINWLSGADKARDKRVRWGHPADSSCRLWSLNELTFSALAALPRLPVFRRTNEQCEESACTHSMCVLGYDILVMGNREKWINHIENTGSSTVELLLDGKRTVDRLISPRFRCFSCTSVGSTSSK